ncbi:histidine phosphatase family protein [Frondihabitans cladoniiphilus]|uniref:Histidine phosphatase family protein n=1 Tax=Frondihabitans cladoniiphilus TaxID=715785 RepID=A0ABP8W1K6_9MICO
MRLYLIRHGQTPANVEGRLATAAPGPGLTERGVEQAAALPAALADAGIEEIRVSTLVRTHLTAAPLAASLGLTPVVDGGFREIEAGDLEDATDEESYKLFLDPIYAWVAGDLSPRIPGGPSGVEFFARYDAAVASLAATGIAVGAVVSHGAAIRIWASAQDPALPAAFLTTHNLDNTGIVALDGSPSEGWRIASWAGDPVGGETLADAAAPDPTGQR